MNRFWISSFLKTPTAYLILGAVLVLQSCLAGTDDTKGSNLEKADAQLAAGRCAEALASYEAVVSADSTKSLAYLGQAKAISCLYGINVDSLYGSFFDSTGITVLAMLGSKDSVLNRYLQGSTKSLEPLRRLMDRDTLTRFWRYLDTTTTSEEAEDPYFNARKARMETYLVNANLRLSGHRAAAKFPLTDGVAGQTEMLKYLVVAEITRASAGFYDFDGNGGINFSTVDSLIFKISFSNPLSPDSFDLSIDDLLKDSAAFNQLNELVGSWKFTTTTLCPMLGNSCVPDTATIENTGNIDSVIASLGAAVLFYQFGDKKDNDGDGCIDEEIMDEKDNDLDGYVDEDARVIPDNKPDGVDNDRDGRTDPVTPPSGVPGNDSAGREARVGETVYPTKPYVLGFVHAYLIGSNELALQDFSTTFIKIKKASPQELINVRLAIQKDSLAVRIPLGGPVPDSLKAKLQNAKTLIGGCWRNYP